MCNRDYPRSVSALQFPYECPRCSQVPQVWGCGHGRDKRAVWNPQLPKASEQISFKAKGKADLLETKLSVLSAKKNKEIINKCNKSQNRCTVSS